MSSEYEHNVGKLLAERKEKLDELMKSPEFNKQGTRWTSWTQRIIISAYMSVWMPDMKSK